MGDETANNGRTHAETRHRLAESRRLQNITAQLLRELTLDQVTDLVRQEARQLTGAAGGGVFLIEEDAWLRWVPGDVQLDPLLERIPMSGTVTGQAVLSGKPVLANECAGDVVETRTPDARTESLLAVPLQIEGTRIGALNVANKQGGFTDDDVHVLALLADVAAIAIENARLREKAKKVAVQEERRWLARELHDSVTQAMYSVTLYAEATRMALSAGKYDVVADNLQEMQAMAREALFGIRLLIFELHPPILEGQGIAEALQIRLSAVENRSGLDTEIHVHGEEQPLPPSTEEELYRIALEVLNNVVKHAKAQRVLVHVRFDEERVSLEISDDGTGYDPANVKESGGVGLRGIRERAERINGNLEITTGLGEGTTVRVDVAL
jgi:signal transduction histidine kinase